MTIIGSLSKGRRQELERTTGRQYQSILIMLVVTSLLFGGIGSRLAYLQLEKGSFYQAKANDNRIRIVPKQPVRGSIFDRQGQLLATTRLSHSAYLWAKAPQQKNWSQNLKLLANILEVPAELIQQRVEQAGYNFSTLIPIARDLTPAQITALEEYRHQLRWIEVDTDKVRHYPQGQVAAHILGYTGELNSEELAQRRADGYRLGDFMGKMGVEFAFEKLLRGEWGGLALEVNGAGQVLRVLGQKKASTGQDITLTLDLKLQKAAEAALGKRKGAVVVLDPNSGGVLAMASYPTFDPNIFSARITPEVWQQLQEQENPFLNRALQGFPPASTFKIVTTAAGMESGKYPPNTILGTYPYLSVGNTKFGEWNKAGFGRLGYVSALAWSSNTFYGQIGRGVGGKTLIEWARKFGFGSKTGIELGGESAGLIADEAWKRDRFDGWGWTDGDSVNMSIGQGFTLATPLQVAVMFAAVANGGDRVQPHFLATETNPKKVNLQLKPETVSILQRGLRAVVASGTGNKLNVAEIPPAAGKSGTAEAPPGESHAWFGAYAPYDKPEIVVVAFAEHSGGGGGSVAAPIVRQVMEAYFAK